jgi:hypothetical protein
MSDEPNRIAMPTTSSHLMFRSCKKPSQKRTNRGRGSGARLMVLS